MLIVLASQKFFGLFKRRFGKRAWASGFDDWVRDLNSFIQHLHNEHDVERKDLLFVSYSVGSVMAITWLLNYGAGIRGCILGAPAFSIKLYVPLALPTLRLVSRFSPNRFVTSFAKGRTAAPSIRSFRNLRKFLFGASMIITLLRYWIECRYFLPIFGDSILLKFTGPMLVLAGFIGLTYAFNLLGEHYSPLFDDWL